MPMIWHTFSSTVQRAALEGDDRGPFDIIVTTIMLTLATILVLMRVLARRMKKVWGPEDWFCIAALVTLLASGSLNYVQVANGLGHHVNFVPLDQQTVVSKCLLALECLYNITMVLVKFSYCHMYLRLFPNLRYHVYVVGGFVAVWGVAFIFLCLLQCTPVAKFWEQEVEGTCLDPRPIFVTNAALNFLSDIALLCMPMTQVIRLQMKTVLKISLCSIFIVGGFTSVSGLYRIKTLLAVDPHDTTWTFVDSNIWTIIEMSCTIMSACLPTLRPILSKISGTFSSHQSSNDNAVTARARQMSTRARRDRSGSDSTEYVPIYRPLSGTNVSYPSKVLEVVPVVKTSNYELSKYPV